MIFCGSPRVSCSELVERLEREMAKRTKDAKEVKRVFVGFVRIGKGGERWLR